MSRTASLSVRGAAATGQSHDGKVSHRSPRMGCPWDARVAGQREEDIVERRAPNTEVFHVDAAVVQGSSRSDQHFGATLDGNADLFEVGIKSWWCGCETGNECGGSFEIVPFGHAHLQERCRPDGPSTRQRCPGPRPARCPSQRSGSPDARPPPCTWVVSRTVAPSATNSSISAHRSFLVRGSSPVVGSSRKRIGGRPIRLAARSSRRLIPPE